MRASRPTVWTPAPVTNAVEEAQSPPRAVRHLQREEKAVAEMFDAIVERGGLSGQPPGRVATGEHFAVDSLLWRHRDTRFLLLGTRRRIGRVDTPGFSHLLTPRAAFGAPPTDAAGASRRATTRGRRGVSSGTRGPAGGA